MTMLIIKKPQCSKSATHYSGFTRPRCSKPIFKDGMCKSHYSGEQRSKAHWQKIRELQEAQRKMFEENKCPHCKGTGMLVVS